MGQPRIDIERVNVGYAVYGNARLRHARNTPPRQSGMSRTLSYASVVSCIACLGC